MRRNKIIIKGLIAEIFISSSHGNYVAIIDKEDILKLGEGSWAVNKILKSKLYVRNSLTGQYLHRIILPTDKEIDHIDGNPLNNRKSNLRECTHSENTRNIRKTTLKGVYPYQTKKGTRYYTRLKCDGVDRSLGGFLTKEEAARAYDKLAMEYHGEFSNLNFKGRQK